MRRAAALLLAMLALGAACSTPEPREPVELQVSGRRTPVVTFSVVIPEGWEHIDYGERHELRRELERISIEGFRAAGAGFDEDVDHVLARIESDGRRETASREPFALDSLRAVTLDTWDRVSHQYRKRFLFVEAGGVVLAVHMSMGQFESMVAEYLEGHPIDYINTSANQTAAAVCAEVGAVPKTLDELRRN